MAELSPELIAQQEWAAEKARNDQDFQLVLWDLDLSEENLRGRKILDAGAGSRRFGVGCITHDLTKDVYSLDESWLPKTGDEKLIPEIRFQRTIPADIRAELDKRTMTAKAEAIPVRDSTFDLVVVNAVPYSTDELPARLRELLRVGKEVRIYPIRVEPRSNVETYEQVSLALREEGGFDFDVEYKTTREGNARVGKESQYIKHQVLILRKKEDPQK